MALAGCGEPQARQRGQRGHVRETRYHTCTWPLRACRMGDGAEGTGGTLGYGHLGEPMSPVHVLPFLFVRSARAFFLLVFSNQHFGVSHTTPDTSAVRLRVRASPRSTHSHHSLRDVPRAPRPLWPAAGATLHSLLSFDIFHNIFLFIQCRTTLPHSPGNAAPLRRALAGSTPKPSALSAAPRRRAAVAPPRVAP